MTDESANTRDLDWKLLSMPMLMVGGALLIGALITIPSTMYVWSIEDSLIKAEKKLRIARNKKAAARENINLFNEYHQQYSDLARRGIIDEEQRLNWIETLRDIQQKLRLPKVSYSFKPRTKYDSKLLPKSNEIQVMASDTRLDISLLHEIDLINIFEWLDQRALGQYAVKYCFLNRKDHRGDFSIDAGNINAQCVLEWYTLTKKAAKK